MCVYVCVFQATAAVVHASRQPVDLIPVERVLRCSKAGPAADLMVTSFDLVTSTGSSPDDPSDDAAQELRVHSKGK